MFGKNMLEELMKKSTQQQSQMEEMQKLMQEAQDDPDVVEAMQAMQGMPGMQGMADFGDIMKQMQNMQGVPGMNDALKQMQPGMDEAMKQIQGAQAIIADQIKQAMAQHGKTAVQRGNTMRPEAQSKPAAPASATVGSAYESTNNILFTPLEGGLKWIGDTHVEFGSYPQTADGGVQKILWRVLDRKNGELLLLSEHILDNKQYQDKADFSVKRSDKKEDIERARLPWERCDLRRWLNDYFYNNAFNAQEKSQIIERLSTGNGAYIHRSYKPRKGNIINLSILDDDTYEKYEDYGCNDTHDRVFLLNVKEAIDYFKNETYIIDQTVWIANTDRDAKATEFALERGKRTEANGSITFSLYPFSGETWSKVNGKNQRIKVGEAHIGSVNWWLRNIGINDVSMFSPMTTYHASQVCTVHRGAIHTGGTTPSAMNMGVRPAIVIKMS